MFPQNTGTDFSSVLFTFHKVMEKIGSQRLGSVERLQLVQDAFPSQGITFSVITIFHCRGDLVICLLIPELMAQKTIAFTKLLVVDDAVTANMASTESSVKHPKLVELEIITAVRSHASHSLKLKDAKIVD